MSGNYPFERPVIILAAPRSGSTLLFETLAHSAELWTIGGESHLLIEDIPQLNPLSPFCDSNALDEKNATPEIVRLMRQRFYQRLKNSRGDSILSSGIAPDTRVRLLEKTPKNALRVPFLNKVFPDALFIYLFRNPRENISSMLDAWLSGRFVTYPALPGRNSRWSLLLPPGWQSYSNAPLEEIVAFQWRSANMAILESLGQLDRNRWISISYGQQVNSPGETAQRICDFCGLAAEKITDAISGAGSRLSRYTLAPPSGDKWHRNIAQLEKILPGLKETTDYIRAHTEGLPAEEFDLSINASINAESTRGAVQ